MNPMFIDLETQSAVSIKNVLEYVSHPSTRILSAVARHDGRNIIWIPPGRAPRGYTVNSVYDTVYYGAEPPFDPSLTWVAHNAYGFDQLIWDRLYPSHKPSQWLDTIPICRAARLPAALDKVTKLLFGEGKREYGQAVIEALCTARYVNGRCIYNIGTSPLWHKLIEYNVHDVVLLERVWDAVAKYFQEWELLRIDNRINSRGIRFDKILLREILRAWNSCQQDAFAYIADVTDGQLSGTDLRSPKKVDTFLKSRGLSLDTLNKHTITIHDDGTVTGRANGVETEFTDIDPIVIEVLQARQTVTRGSKGKVERLLEIAAVSDDRLRHSLVFHGAHSGRWSGRGLQPHNLARPIDPERLRRVLDYYDSTGKLVLGDKPADELTELMRPIFLAGEGNELLIADYSAVEARCAAWLADDTNLLAAFRREDAGEGHGVYCEAASRLFGREITRKDKAHRQVGKVVVLGANYGMSGLKLGVYCKMARPRVDLAALGLDPLVVVKEYRSWISDINRYWYDLERECVKVVQNNDYVQFGRLQIYMIDNYLSIQLPSGRRMMYRNPRVEDIEPAFVSLYNLAPFKKPTILYNHPHGYLKALYGALIFENVCQGICRDILAVHIVECETRADPFPVVLHVHDSIIPETRPGRKEELEAIMSRPPLWADGFPLKVEVHASRRML